MIFGVATFTETPTLLNVDENWDIGGITRQRWQCKSHHVQTHQGSYACLYIALYPHIPIKWLVEYVPMSGG